MSLTETGQIIDIKMIWLQFIGFRNKLHHDWVWLESLSERKVCLMISRNNPPPRERLGEKQWKILFHYKHISLVLLKTVVTYSPSPLSLPPLASITQFSVFYEIL